MYCELVGFGEGEPAEEVEQEGAHKEPAPVIFKGNTFTAEPGPEAEFHRHRFHEPVEQRCQQGAVNDDGPEAHIRARGLVLRAQPVPGRVQQQANRNAAAHHHNEPVHSDDQGYMTHLRTQGFTIHIITEEKLVVDARIFGEDAGKKTDGEEEIEGAVPGFLGPEKQCHGQEHVQRCELHKKRTI